MNKSYTVKVRLCFTRSAVCCYTVRRAAPAQYVHLELTYSGADYVFPVSFHSGYLVSLMPKTACKFKNF